MRLPAIAVAALLLAPSLSQAGWWRPRWTHEKPAIVTRHGKRVAVAVGYSRTGSEALSRDDAEARARKELLDLLGGGQAGTVDGARVARVYKDRRGGVYLELEAPLP